MVRLNSLFPMLRWFFTPVKLYGGDGGDSGDSNDSGGFGDSAFGDYEDYGFEEEYGGDFGGGDSGGTDYTNVEDTVSDEEFNAVEEAMDAFNDADEVESYGEFGSLGTIDSAFSVTTPTGTTVGGITAGGDAFSGGSYGSSFDSGISDGGSWEYSQDTYFSGSNTIGGGTTEAGSTFTYEANDRFGSSTLFDTAEYEQLDMYDNGYVSTELDYGVLIDTERTTSVMQEEDGSYGVSQLYQSSFFDYTRTFGASTTPTGNLDNAKTYSGVGIMGMDEISWDTHYESAHNQELSFLGELALDVGEIIAGGRYYDTPQSLVDHAYNIDYVGGVLGNVSPVFKMASLFSIAALPVLNKNRSLSDIESQFGYNTPYQGFAGFSAGSGFSSVLASLTSSANNGTLFNGIGSFEDAGNAIKAISSTNNLYNNTGTTETLSLTQPSLSPTSRYASMALLGADAGRSDYAWDAMNSFRVDFTEGSTVDSVVNTNSLIKD